MKTKEILRRTAGGEEWIKILTRETFAEEVVRMGWGSVEEFESDAGEKVESLLGVWFQVVDGRVYTRAS